MHRWPFLLLISCAVSVKEPRELDEPGPIAETPEDTDTPDGVVDSDPIEPEPEPLEVTRDGVVCFLGADRADNTCLDLVLHDASWGEPYAYPSSSDARYPTPIRYLDLSTAPPDLAVGPNFVLSEFAEAWKGRFGLLQPKLIRRMQDLRDDIGEPLIINSAYRNQDYNAGVGGADFSRHLYGDAADMRTDALTLEELGALCEEHGAGYVGYYESHVHCDWRDDANESVLFDRSVSAARARSEATEFEAHLVRGPVWSAPASGWDEGEPLREWTASDADGTVIARHTGRTWTPPPHATTVEVWVGRTLSLGLPVEGEP